MTDWYARPNVMLDDGKVRFRASAVGGCPVALAWDLRDSRGYDIDLPGQNGFPENVQIAMDESSALESHTLDLLNDGGWNLTECQEPNNREFAGGMVLEGTVDAITDKGELVEIKTVGDSLYAELQKSSDLDWRDCSSLAQKYRWQVASYRLIYDKPVHLAVAKKKNGALTGEFFVIDSESMSIPSKDDLVTRMSEVIELAGQKDLSCTGGELCKWENRHSRPTVDVGADLTLLRIQEATVKQINADIRELREKISAAVRDVGGKAECNGVKLTWVETHVVEKKPREYDRNYLKITWGEETNSDKEDN